VRAPTPSPPRVVVPAAPALVLERSLLLSTLAQQTRRSVAFANRLRVYIRVGGALLTALEYINTVGDIASMASAGTVLGDAQSTADRVRAQSDEAKTRANETYDSISLFSAVAQVSDALGRGDTTALFDLSASLGDFGLEVSEQAFRYGELERDLRARSRALHELSEMFARLAQVPQGYSTAPQASALAMYISLGRLSGTLGSAADNYGEARTLLSFLANHTLELAHRANSEAWTQVFNDIARRLAEMEQQRTPAAAPAPAAPSP
jgi:hypothetical protein